MKYKRLFVLNEPYVLRVSPALAEEIGLAESIVFLQIEYLISISGHPRAGRLWTYQSTRDLQSRHFRWWSISTIHRVIKRLEKRRLIIIEDFNSRSYDRTRWFAINFEEAVKLNSISIRAQEP